MRRMWRCVTLMECKDLLDTTTPNLTKIKADDYLARHEWSPPITPSDGVPSQNFDSRRCSVHQVVLFYRKKPKWFAEWESAEIFARRQLKEKAFGNIPH